MIEIIKSKIAEFKVKKHLKDNSIHQQSFSEYFQKSFNYFVIMPANEVDFRSSFIVLEFLESHNKTLTIFTNDFRVALLPVKFRNKTFSFNLSEITKLNLPSNELITKLKKFHCDVVIDLNREDNLFFRFIANLVEAKIRMGINSKKTSDYYNLIFYDDISDSKQFYSNLINFMKMF